MFVRTRVAHEMSNLVRYMITSRLQGEPVASISAHMLGLPFSVNTASISFVTEHCLEHSKMVIVVTISQREPANKGFHG